MIRPIKSKDRLNFIDYCLKHDNQLTITEIKILFKAILRSKIKCLIYEEKIFRGLFFLIKNNNTKYIQLFTDNNVIAIKLIKQFIWNNKDDMVIKFDKWNSLISKLRKLGFKFISKKGDKIIELNRKFDKKFYFSKKRIPRYE